jgi:hypothetical protein
MYRRALERDPGSPGIAAFDFAAFAVPVGELAAGADEFAARMLASTHDRTRRLGDVITTNAPASRMRSSTRLP